MTNISLHLSCAVFSLFSLCCHGNIWCYFGNTEKTTDVSGELTNMTCSDGYRHTQVVSRHNKTEVVNITYRLHGLEAEAGNISHCLVFRFQDGRRDFSCDHDHKCSSLHPASNYHYNVDYKGSNGSVYCCQNDLCNGGHVLSSDMATSTRKSITDRATPPSTAISTTQPRTTTTVKSGRTSTRAATAKPTASPAIMCYHGNNASVVKLPCSMSHCVTEVTLAQNGLVKATQFSCDDSHRCHLHPLDDSGCYKGSNLQALTTMTCCCSLSLCNSPSNGRTIHPNKPLKPPKPSNANPSTLTVDGGIAGAVLFVLLVVVTVGVIVRRCRRVPSETTYSYTQLTADLAEERDEAPEDEYMLVG